MTQPTQQEIDEAIGWIDAAYKSGDAEETMRQMGHNFYWDKVKKAAESVQGLKAQIDGYSNDSARFCLEASNLRQQVKTMREALGLISCRPLGGSIEGYVCAKNLQDIAKQALAAVEKETK